MKNYGIYKMNLKDYGKIVCASIIKDKKIYMSYKGHHVIFKMEPMGYLRNEKQGFVTENGYFVNRKLALLIAQYYDQINYKHNPYNELNSEDLKQEKLKLLTKQNNYSYMSKDNK